MMPFSSQSSPRENIVNSPSVFSLIQVNVSGSGGLCKLGHDVNVVQMERLHYFLPPPSVR